MKKKLCYFCLFGIICAFTFFKAQYMIPLNEQKYLHTLKKNLERNHVSDTKKANSLFLLSQFYLSTNPILSEKYLKLSESYLHEPLTIAKYNYYKALFYISSDKTKSVYYFKKAIGEFSKLNSEEADTFQAEAWYRYTEGLEKTKGFCYIIQRIIHKSIPLAQKHNNDLKTGYFYTRIGTFLVLNSEFEKAKYYLLKGKDILEKTAPGSAELYTNYITISNAYSYNDEIKEAEEYLEKARILIKQYTDSSYYSALIYSKTLIYMVSHQNDKALAEIKIGIQLSEKFGDKALQQFFILKKIEILIELKRNKEAKMFLENILINENIAKDAKIRKNIFKTMVTISELQKNNKEALKWSKKYSALSDSLNEKRISSDMALMEVKYRTAEKQKEIIQSRIDINIKNQYIWILVFLILLVVLLIVFLYVHYKDKQTLSLQKEINLKQKLIKQVQAEDLKITRALLDGEEYERERIAKDLHDGLGGLFMSVKLNFSNWAKSHLKNQDQDSFFKIVKQLDYSLNELRRIAENMMPSVLADHGLEEALKDLCTFFATDKIKVEFQPISINSNLPHSFQLNIYRIIQELIANAVKHSKADTIFVQCTYSYGIFLLCVEDNGIGGVDEFQKQYSGNGLVNIKKRVNFMKGKIEIISKKNEGTSVNIELIIPDSNEQKN